MARFGGRTRMALALGLGAALVVACELAAAPLLDALGASLPHGQQAQPSCPADEPPTGVDLAALHGQGVILQPDFLVGDDLRRGDLVELLPGWRSIELGIHALYASRKHLPMKTRRLVDFLAEAFAAPSWAD